LSYIIVQAENSCANKGWLKKYVIVF